MRLVVLSGKSDSWHSKVDLCLRLFFARHMSGALLVPATEGEDLVARNLCHAKHYRMCYFGVAEVAITRTGRWDFAADGDWQRVTSASSVAPLGYFDYSNWCAGEPNNAGSSGDQKIAGYCGDPTMWVGS